MILMASSRETVFGDEDVHLPCTKIIHHQLLAWDCSVEMQHIDDVAVRELKPNYGRARVGGAGAGRCLLGAVVTLGTGDDSGRPALV
jgi:hypothetical protein